MTNRRGRRWSAEEDNQLQWWWGVISAQQIADKIGRTAEGVIHRGRKLKLGSPRRGYLSMAELERRSGFARTTIMLTAKRLGLPLRRQPTYQKSTRKRVRPAGRYKGHKNYAIGSDVAEQLIEELLKLPDGRRRQISYRGEWGGPNKPDACVDCGESGRPHCSKGLCARCYMRRWRAQKDKRLT